MKALISKIIVNMSKMIVFVEKYSCACEYNINGYEIKESQFHI